ncbi:MAG: hypothetical protein KDA93_23605 [Planctomycetaceae bacterium]|nr:hypothetical protein [Planctomycetaceae bacterium]
MLFVTGIICWIVIGALILGLSILWFTLHFGEDFQERYAKGVAWSVVADLACGGAILLLLLAAKWIGDQTGLL